MLPPTLVRYKNPSFDNIFNFNFIFSALVWHYRGPFQFPNVLLLKFTLTMSMTAGETSRAFFPMQAGRIRQGRASAAMPAPMPRTAAAAAGAARRYGGTGMECQPGTYYAVTGETRALVDKSFGGNKHCFQVHRRSQQDQTVFELSKSE